MTIYKLISSLVNLILFNIQIFSQTAIFVLKEIVKIHNWLIDGFMKLNLPRGNEPKSALSKYCNFLLYHSTKFYEDYCIQYFCQIITEVSLIFTRTAMELSLKIQKFL